MPVKVGKGKGGKKKGRKKKGGKKKKGQRSKSPKKGAFKRAADELAADERLQFNIMKEDHGKLLQRARGAEDQSTMLRTKLKHLQEDEKDIFENLRSKVEKSRAYAKVLLDQRDVLEREKKDAIEALEGQLDKQTSQLRHAKGQLKILKERWHEQQDRMKSAAHTLATRAETEEKMRQLEKSLHDATIQVKLRESQNEIISSIKENAQHQAVAAMLLECLKQFPDMVVVQRESVASLTKILNLHNCNLVLNSNGVGLTLASIRDHRGDQHLVAACMRLLWRLFVDAGKEVVEPLLTENGCLNEVLTSLQMHPSSRRIHYNAVGLLKCLLPEGSCNFAPKRRKERRNQYQKTDSTNIFKRNVSSPFSRASSSHSNLVPQTTIESLPSLSKTPSRSRARSPASLLKSVSTPMLPEIVTPTQIRSTSMAWNANEEKDEVEEREERDDIKTMISLKTVQKWRSKMAKKIDVGPIVAALCACMTRWPTKIEIVEKCIAVLATLFFEETEMMAKGLKDYSSMRSLERGEAQRGFALVVIDEVITGGERAFLQLLVNNLKNFEGSTSHEIVLQGMICLMFKKILPDDPELKTLYLRAFKELDIPKRVFSVMSLPHAMVDSDLRNVGLWILEYFAMPPPTKRKKKKHRRQEVQPPTEAFI